MTISKLILTMIFVIPFSSFGQTAKEYNSKGLLKAKEQDYKGAIEEYDKALDIDSTNWIVLFNRGISKAKLKDFQAAIADYTRSINIKPNADTYFNRAISYYKSSANQEAIQDFDKALELNPKITPEIYFQRASAEFKVGRYQDAISDFTKAIEIDPNDSKAYFNRGIARHNLKIKDQSCADLNKAKELGYKAAEEYITKFCQ